MPPRRRGSPIGANGREDWIAVGEGRQRSWAYEELLFGSADERARAKELARVVHEIELERAELARLHEELDTHLERVETLDRRLDELTADDAQTPSAPMRLTLPHTPGDGGDGEHARRYDPSSRLLAHCEGFDVDSPEGPVGFVEGVRFMSRIDRPDLLEVRGGTFGRQLILVPIELVDEIRLPERLVLLRSVPPDSTRHPIDDLGERLRRVLHLARASP